MHSFMLTETFQKCFINACPWVNPIPIYGHICPGYSHTPPEAQPGGPYSIFVGGKFSRTKVCDLYPLPERAFNFPNMAFFETKSKIGTKMVRKHFSHDHRFRCVYISKAGDRQLCAVSCLQNRVPMELLLPLHWGTKHCLYLHIQYKSCIYLNFLHEIFK